MELLLSEKITDENRPRLFQINQHLIQCSSCGESYRKLVKLHDAVESWSLPGQYKAEQKLQHMKTCLALVRAQKAAAPAVAQRIEAWLQNYAESSAKISLQILGGVKMAVDTACLFISETGRIHFGYANLAAARGEPPKTDNSLLIDRENAFNRIKVEGQRAIKITLGARGAAAPLVALIPADAAQPTAIIHLAFDEQAGRRTAVIDDIPDGEYDLIIEAQDNA